MFFKKLFKAALCATALTAILGFASADDFDVVVEGQFDASIEGNFDEWQDLKTNWKSTGKTGEYVTYTADYGQKVQFSGNYVGLNTSYKGETDADGKYTTPAALVSVKLDGVEVKIDDPSYLSAEGLNGGMRINLTNQWNSDIKTQPINPEVWTKTSFQKIEIVFYVGEVKAADDQKDDTKTEEKKDDTKTETKTDDKKTDDKKTDANAKTGDATSVVALAFVALVAMGGAVVVSKKRV